MTALSEYDDLRVPVSTRLHLFPAHLFISSAAPPPFRLPNLHSLSSPTRSFTHSIVSLTPTLVFILLLCSSSAQSFTAVEISPLSFLHWPPLASTPPALEAIPLIAIPHLLSLYLIQSSQQILQSLGNVN
jgi:hypothetical protein